MKLYDASRPKLIDLYCGPGGAAWGYWLAGWQPVGVDLKAQRSYPFPMVQADVLEALASWDLTAFTAAHASPPCQDHMRTPTHNQSARGTAWLLGATREALTRSGLPWVMENVPGAPLRADYLLCGCMFPGLQVRSERWFETSWRAFELMTPHDHSGEVLNRFRSMHGPFYRRHGRPPTRREVAAAMGCDWMKGDEHQQAVPPAFTEHIGAALLGVAREGGKS